MKSKSIKAEVWRLILIPVLAISLLLAGTMTYLYAKQLSKFVHFRGDTLTQKTAHMSHYALRKGDEVMVNLLLQSVLEEPFIRAASLYDQESGKRYHVGPSFTPSESEVIPDIYTPFQRVTEDSIIFFSPIVNQEGRDPLGWVEVELLTAPYLVMRYQTLLISSLVTLLCLLLAAWLAVNLHTNISTPLSHIKSVVRKLAKGKLAARVDTQQCREFSELAESVNAMALSMEKAQQDMQAHIDQSTEDLRETLETIEIQNIDLNIARKEALQASRIKSEFLANTSHEIRTPLNGILGFTNLALKTDLDEQQREYLNTIRDSSHNLLTVINSILDFSKIEAGKLTLDYAPLPLRRAVDETLQILAPDAHEKNLQLIAYFDPLIPTNLLGDSLRFKQVLSNLVSNAIKFSNKGNILVDVIMLRRQEAQATVKITVSDEGIGLSREQKNSLFSAFSQADPSSTREHGGTGLGLAISRGLVERMGGEIGVESDPDQGASFWFTARLGIDKKQPAPSQRVHFDSNKILVCGENTASTTQILRLLQEWRIESQSINAIHDIFITLRGARDAGAPFDIMILDIPPSERKIQPVLLHNLTEQLQEEFDCQVVACCTAAHQRLLRSHSDSSPTIFINKPLASDALLQTLGRLLNVTIKDGRTLEHEGEEKTQPNASVLVVDDNPANLQLAAELLRGLNTEVAQASSGKQALELCAKQSFDVIFMDIQMPGMDGIETTRRLRSTETGNRRTPIIALTAHSMTEQKHELLIAGMDDCVSKPISEAQLAHIINRWASLGGKKEIISSVTLEQRDTSDQARISTIGDIAENTSSVDVLLSLRLANNKPALARDMLIMLLQHLDAERKEINAAFEAQDYSTQEELVHRLYGSCCYCGVPRLKKISGLLDKLLQAKQFDQAPGVMTSFNNAVDDVLRWGEDRDIHGIFTPDETQ